MSISSRGNRHILVLDSCAVPVNEMFERLVDCEDITEIFRKYPVNADEVFECAEACLDLNPLTEDDFIVFTCTPCVDDSDGETEFELSTESVSDRVYVGVITHARTFYPDVDDLEKLYTDGLFLILAECVLDLSQNKKYFTCSELHTIIFEAFERAFPRDVMESIDKLAKTFNVHNLDTN